MKILVIDHNNSFAQELVRLFTMPGEMTAEQISFSEVRKTRELANVVKLHLADGSAALLLINANLIFGNEKRQFLKGIELLTWLRINGVMTHVVMYSFQRAETIGAFDQRNLILFSKGVTFHRLSTDFSPYALRGLSKIQADEENLTSYLRASFRIGEFRHRDANWWGLKQLWDVHRVYKEGRLTAGYPDLINDSLNDLNNAVAVYLHGLDGPDVVGLAEQLRSAFVHQKQAKEHEMAEASGMRELASQDVDKWLSKISGVQKDRDDLRQKMATGAGGTDAVSYQSARSAFDIMEEKINKLQAMLISARDEESEFVLKENEISKAVEEIDRQISDITSSVKETIFSEIPDWSLPGDRKVLVVDDMAAEGFEEIYRIMLGAQVRTVPFEPHHDENAEQLFDATSRIIDEFQPHVVLLDLRLLDETEAAISPNLLSGKQILDKVKARYPALPIIITTASNRVSTRDILMNAGADAYWVKEGLDERNTPSDSAYNYFLLKFLVDKLTGQRFEILRRLSDIASKFDEEQNGHWSMNAQWENGEETSANVEELAKTLSDSVFLYRNHLRWTHLRNDKDWDRDESFVISALINKLAGIVEIVHSIGSNVDNKTQLIRDRMDNAGVKLFRLRGDFSHSNFRKANIEILGETVTLLAAYLTTDPRG